MVGINERSGSKLTGYQNNITMRPYPKAVTPERFNRGASPVSAGFPIEVFGNDGLYEVWE